MTGDAGLFAMGPRHIAGARGEVTLPDVVHETRLRELIFDPGRVGPEQARLRREGAKGGSVHVERAAGAPIG
jgi:hypothetical protein